MHQEPSDRPEKKERDPKMLSSSKRMRSERFMPRNERDCVEVDSWDESQGFDDVQLSNHQRKGFSSSRLTRLKVADEMIYSARIKRSHDCRTSSGSGRGFGEELRRPESPKSSGTIEDGVDIEIVEVLSAFGSAKQPHSSNTEDDSENSLKPSEIKGIYPSSSSSYMVGNDIGIGGEGEKFAVGNIYSVKMITGDEFRGIVMAYNPIPNYVFFEEGSKPRPAHLKDTRMVNANFITGLSYLGKIEDPLVSGKFRVDIELEGLRAKEALAIRHAEADADRMGVGVTAEAQSIFDALSKTLPVQWENSDILVMKEVRVRSPYLSDCVFGGTFVANNRVKKVLELERRGLQFQKSYDVNTSVDGQNRALKQASVIDAKTRRDSLTPIDLSHEQMSFSHADSTSGVGLSPSGKRKLRQRVARQKHVNNRANLLEMGKNPGENVKMEMRADVVEHFKKINKDRKTTDAIVFVDAENSADDMGRSFDFPKVKSQIEYCLRRKFNNPNIKVVKMTVAGNIRSYMQVEDRDEAVSKDVRKLSVYPRDTICKVCFKKCHSAPISKRVSVKYEQKTDVADSKLKDAMNDCYTWEYGTPANFVLVTGDWDFISHIESLERSNVRVFLVHPSSSSRELRRSVPADRLLSLQTVLAVTDQQLRIPY